MSDETIAQVAVGVISYSSATRAAPSSVERCAPNGLTSAPAHAVLLRPRLIRGLVDPRRTWRRRCRLSTQVWP